MEYFTDAMFVKKQTRDSVFMVCHDKSKVNKSIKYNGWKLWLELPEQLRKLTSFVIFKRNVHDHLLKMQIDLYNVQKEVSLNNLYMSDECDNM